MQLSIWHCAQTLCAQFIFNYSSGVFQYMSLTNYYTSLIEFLFTGYCLLIKREKIILDNF